jgi:hypothetical protein
VATGETAGATLEPTAMKAQTTAASNAVKWVRVVVVISKFLSVDVFRFIPGMQRSLHGVCQFNIYVILQ